MGLFEKIFPKAQTFYGSSRWATLGFEAPTLSPRLSSAYENDLVRASVDTRARHISKLNIDIFGSGKPSTTTKLRKAPNDLCSWSQWLYRVSTILDNENNCFIVPTFDSVGNVSGLFPVLPSKCELVEYKGEPYIRYTFSNGNTAAMELKACGILTRFQYKDDILGGSRTALDNTLDVLDTQSKAVVQAMKDSLGIKFVAQMSNFSKADDLRKEREQFNENNFKSESKGGVVLFPNTYKDIKQVNHQPYVVSGEQSNMIRNNVFDFFGVSENLIQNRATNEELDCFYNGVIEPFAIQLSEVITKMIFTDLEQANGNKIFFGANRLQYMSVSEKVQLVQQLGDRGMLTINEARELFNYPPLPDGTGDNVPIRGEYHMVNEEDNNNASEE